MAGDAVKHGGQTLRGLHCLLHRLIDHHLLHRQLIDRNRRHPFGHRLNLSVQSSGRHGVQHQTHIRSLAPGDLVTGEQHPLGPFRPQTIDPHRGGRAAPDAGGHVADLRLLRHDGQISAERDVRTPGNRKPVHLADHWLHRLPQRHVVLGVAPHELVVLDRIPGHRLRHLT